MVTIITDDYIRDVNSYYWEEEKEMELGIHPTQVKERIEKLLKDLKVDYGKITFLDWDKRYGPIVDVYLDGKFYAPFNYELNFFVY